MSYGMVVILTALLSTMASGLFTTPANAATKYDPYIQSVDTMLFTAGTTTVDMTERWRGMVGDFLDDVIANDTDPARVAMATTAKNNLSLGAGYTVAYDDSKSSSTIQISFFSPNAELEFGHTAFGASPYEGHYLHVEDSSYLYQLRIGRYSPSYSPSYAAYLEDIKDRISLSDATDSMNAGNVFNATLYYRHTIPGVHTHYKYFLIASDNVSYPTGYEGDLVTDGSADNDEDGLTLRQEISQNTSDYAADTDGDGLGDLTESVWFTDRDAVFCDITTTPYTCAYPDPVMKDIYVEIDWMYNPALNRTLKPTNTQLNLVETMFANEGINFHADVGQFGGGSELSDYAHHLLREETQDVPDFFDYKYGGDGIPSHFATERQGIWRYLIYGHGYATSQGESESSGWASVLGDNLFVSGGLIEGLESSVASLDRAIANTIAHELGHTLCLSDAQLYQEQSPECIYKGIDNKSGKEDINNADGYYNLKNYESVMNYRYQLTKDDDFGVVEYSHGMKLSDDHDDWTAIKSNMGGFSGSHTIYTGSGVEVSQLSIQDGHVIVEEPSVDDLRRYASDEHNNTLDNQRQPQPTPDTVPKEASSDRHQLSDSNEIEHTATKEPAPEQPADMQDSGGYLWITSLLVVGCIAGIIGVVFAIKKLSVGKHKERGKKV